MGTLLGHVVNGFGFWFIGLWHLFNHAKLYASKGRSYRSLSWFPVGPHRHLELYFIMGATAVNAVTELTRGFSRSRLFDADGSLLSVYLPNLEHSSIAALIFVYAATALAFDTVLPRAANHGILQMVAAMVFGQELLLFHLHSADHNGVEGQYHWLFQLVVASTLAATLLAGAWPESFVVSYARSLFLLFQGFWLMYVGVMLYTPSFTPKGCSLSLEMDHEGVHCDGVESLHRAKALINIGFSWLLIGLAVFGVSFYLVVMWVYGDEVEYSKVDDQDDAETQRVVEVTTEMVRFQKNRT